MTTAKVAIVMGSDSDLPVMQEGAKILESFGVPCETRILSAHRTPEAARAFAEGAWDRGVRVVIAGAGGAAHLAGFMAAHVTMPVIGVPLAGSALGGVDALYSTVQMPPGIPVATVAVGDFGAKNAAVLAVEILALADPELRRKLQDYRGKMAETVLAKDAKLQKKG